MAAEPTVVTATATKSWELNGGSDKSSSGNPEIDQSTDANMLIS